MNGDAASAVLGNTGDKSAAGASSDSGSEDATWQTGNEDSGSGLQ